MGDNRELSREEYKILMKKRRIRTYIAIFIIIAIVGYLINIMIRNKYFDEKVKYLITMDSKEYSYNDVKDHLDEYRKTLDIKDPNISFGKKLEWGNKPKVLIFHHTAADNLNIKAINEDHIQKGYGAIGYHYYIRRDGTIYAGRPELSVGAHTIGRNYDSIGVCLEGNFEEELVTDVQREAAVRLTVYLMIKYNLEDIMAHKDNYNTLCPGEKFPMDDIKKEVKNNLLQLCVSK